MTQAGRQFWVFQKGDKVIQSDESRVKQRPTGQAEVKRERGGNNEEYTEHDRCGKIKPFRVCPPDCLGLGVADHGTSLSELVLGRFHRVPHKPEL